MEIIKINSIHTGRAYSVEEVEALLPDGKKKIYDRILHRDSVTILPLDENNHIWFVRQYRLGSTTELLELPAGVMEMDEEPLTCAKREIREEIGMAAESWQPLGSYYLAPGYSTENNFSFLAQGLFPSPLEMDEDEFLQVEKYPVEKVQEMLRTHSLHDGKSLAALCLFFSEINF